MVGVRYVHIQYLLRNLRHRRPTYHWGATHTTVRPTLSEEQHNESSERGARQHPQMGSTRQNWHTAYNSWGPREHRLTNPSGRRGRLQSANSSHGLSSKNRVWTAKRLSESKNLPTVARSTNPQYNRWQNVRSQRESGQKSKGRLAQTYN